MVIVKIVGGLGNQMFQYAAGRSLALKNNSRLMLDISSYSTYYRLRDYKLKHFNIEQNYVPVRPRRRSAAAYGVYLAKYLFSRPSGKITVVSRENFASADKLLGLKKTVYLDGYWQSDEYFKDVAGVIAKDFTPVCGPDPENSKILDIIGSSNSVSLHIRRGDYVSNPANKKIYNSLGVDYYLRAAGLIEEKTGKPEFFVFSDEIDWARANLKHLSGVHFMDRNGPEKDYEDLRLMSACKHHVTANSSFSWWGAWLCRNPGKIVISPEKWYAAGKISPGDPVPGEWIRL